MRSTYVRRLRTNLLQLVAAPKSLAALGVSLVLIMSACASGPAETGSGAPTDPIASPTPVVIATTGPTSLVTPTTDPSSTATAVPRALLFLRTRQHLAQQPHQHPWQPLRSQQRLGRFRQHKPQRNQLQRNPPQRLDLQRRPLCRQPQHRHQHGSTLTVSSALVPPMNPCGGVAARSVSLVRRTTGARRPCLPSRMSSSTAPFLTVTSR